MITLNLADVIQIDYNFPFAIGKSYESCNINRRAVFGIFNAPFCSIFAFCTIETGQLWNMGFGISKYSVIIGNIMLILKDRNINTLLLPRYTHVQGLLDNGYLSLFYITDKAVEL